MEIDTQILYIAFSHLEDNDIEDMIIHSVKTFDKLSKEPQKLEYIIGINCNAIDEHKFDVLNDFKIKFKLIDIRTDREYNGKLSKDQRNKITDRSLTHYGALQELFNHVTTKYFMTIDNDCFCLKQGWDVIMKNLLKDNIIMVGSGFHPKQMRYKNFPSVICSMYLTEIWRKINIDFFFDHEKEFKRGNVDVRINNLYKILQVPKNYKLTCDIGSKLPYTARTNNYDGIEFKAIRHKYNNIRDFLVKDINKEVIQKRTEEYKYNNESFFLHLGQGRYRKFRDKPVQDFIKILNKYI